jgi:replicative DNA helicase
MRGLIEQHRVTVAVVDGLEYFVPPAKHSADEEACASALVRSLKRLARELDVVILATLNLKPVMDVRLSKIPVVSDLHEWRSLEQEADQLLFCYRAGFYERNAGGGCQRLDINVIRAKHRTSTWINCLWDPHHEALAELAYK